MNKLTVLEIIIIFVAILFGIKWMISPEGNFEPVIAFCAILITSLDMWRRHINRSDSVIESPKIVIAENTTSNVSSDTKQFPPFELASSCSFFAQRFSQAFPGIRQGKWFEGTQAVERLTVLLAQPLKFSRPNNGWILPIGWLRDGNMTFNDFKTLDKHTVLIDTKELKIKRIYAGFMPNYKQLFVYLEAEAMPPTGLYEKTPEGLKEILDYFGYIWEEYGLYKNTHPVTRAEFDDNAAIILGKPVNLNGDCRVRTRYLSPYNMIISASASSLNQSAFDETLEAYMDSMLKGQDRMEDFIKEVKLLPSALGY